MVSFVSYCYVVLVRASNIVQQQYYISKRHFLANIYYSITNAYLNLLHVDMYHAINIALLSVTIIFSVKFGFFYNCRGTTFRRTLSRIGEVRNILPQGVQCVALTATATKSLRSRVSSIIGMNDPTVVAVSPCKKNIMYSMSTSISIRETFGPILEAIRRLRVFMPRIIIYCRRYEECSNLYIFFKNGLAEKFLEPSDAPDKLG